MEPDFSLGIIFGEYFFYCLWGMFSLGNILFKVIFQNYRFWGRFLFVKTFSPRILRQMAQVLGSPEKKIHPDFMSFPETHVMAAKPP